MIIRRKIDITAPPTAEQEKMLREMDARPVLPDEDCPALSEEQIAALAGEAREARDHRRELQNRQTVAVRLSPAALRKAKSLGKGYTSVLSRILEATLENDDALRRYL